MYRIEVSIPECSLQSSSDFSLTIDSSFRSFSVPTTAPVTVFVPNLSIRQNLTVVTKQSGTVYRLGVNVGDFLPEMKGTVDQWFRMETLNNESGSECGDSAYSISLRLVLNIERLDSDRDPDSCPRCPINLKRLKSLQIEVESLTSQLRVYPSLQSDLETLKISSTTVTYPQSLSQQERDYFRFAIMAIEHKARLAETLQQEVATLQGQVKVGHAQHHELRLISEETTQQLTAELEKITKDKQAIIDEKNGFEDSLAVTKSQLAAKVKIEKQLSAKIEFLEKELTVKSGKALLQTQTEFELTEAKVHASQLEDRNKSLTMEFKRISEEFARFQSEYSEQSALWAEEKEKLNGRLLACQEELGIKTKLADALMMDKVKSEGQIQMLTMQNKVKEDGTATLAALERKLKTSEDLRGQLSTQFADSLSSFDTEIAKLASINDHFSSEISKLQGQVSTLQQDLLEKERRVEKLTVETSTLNRHVVVLEHALCVQEDSRAAIEKLLKERDHASGLGLELMSEVDSLSDKLLRHSEKILACQRVIAKLADIVEKQNADLRVIRKLFHNQPPYVAVEGDVVDEALGKYLNARLIPSPIPFRREEGGMYAFGTRKVFVKVEQGRLIVRVGGGFMNIEDFISSYSPTELEKLESRRPERTTDPFVCKLSQYFENKESTNSLKTQKRTSSSNQRRRSPP